ncbi:MAG: hypothetical protein HQL46_12965, partial [Gammaproteobacteria bacterium]|nr:hypothetical protein [Gammaproteobacteria bacterium]
IVSNFTGPYDQDVLSLDNRKTHFSYGFVRPENFIFSPTKLDRKKHICLLGSVEYINEPEVNPFFTSSWYADIFQSLIQQGFVLHLFTSTKPKGNTDPYAELAANYPENFYHHGFIPGNELLQAISGFDFGLGLINLNQPVLEAYDYQLSSMLHARLISYLSAGLPIIINQENKLANQFFSPFNVAICVKHNDVDTIAKTISEVDLNMMKQSVLEFQQWYRQNKPQQQIADFIDQAVNGSKQ